jgi:fructan beta-fructosidase
VAPGFYECPDLFPLPVTNAPGRTEWVMVGAENSYLIGDFDGAEFRPKSDRRLLDHGSHFYAAQTYNDITPSDGRRIQIGWMRGGQYPGMPFNQQLSFPCELSLRQTGTGLVVCRWPVREINTIREPCLRLQAVGLRGSRNPLAALTGDLFDIELDFMPGTAQTLELGVAGTPVVYRVHDETLACLDRTARLAPASGRVRLRVLVDRTSVEVFGNGGLVAMSCCFLPKADEPPLSLMATGGEARVLDLTVHRLRSTWP